MQKRKNDFIIIEEPPQRKAKRKQKYTPRRRRFLIIFAGISLIGIGLCVFFLINTRVFSNRATFTSADGRLSNYEQALLIGSARKAVPLGWIDVSPLSENVEWSPDGTMLAVSGYEVPIHLYDANNLEASPRIMNSVYGVQAMAFSADSKRIAGVKFARGGVSVWDTTTGEEIAHADWPEDILPSIRFRPDGKVVAVGWETHTIFLWDTVNEPQIIGLTDWPPMQNQSVINPDGKRIAAGGSDGYIWTWDAETGLALHRWFAESYNPVARLAFSPDNSTLATGDVDHFVKVWDYEAQHNLNSHFGHAAGITAIAFSPDSKILASGSGADGTVEGTVRLWDWDSQSVERYVDVLQGHRLPVESITFSPDGQRLAFLVNGVPEEKTEVQANVWLWDIRAIMDN